MSVKQLIVLGMVAMMAAGCSKDDANPVTPGGGSGATPRTPVPEQFVGTWYNGSVSSSNFFNPSTGHWSNAVGSGSFYRFYADGQFEFGWQMYVSNYGCTNIGMVYRRGTVAVQDSVLVLYDQYTRVMGQDECNSSKNYERPGEITTETLIAQPGWDDWGTPGLYLRRPDTGYSLFLLEQ